jgi:gliding motility-associated-like protein
LSDKDYIKDLFSEKLGNYEAKVNPELWNGIASQIGAAGTTAATGITIATKWIIGISIASVVAISAVVVMSSSEEDPIIEDKIAEVQTNSLEENKEQENTITTESENNSAATTEVSVQERANNGNIYPEEQTEVDPEERRLPEGGLAVAGESGGKAHEAEENTDKPESSKPLQREEQPKHTPDPIVEEPSLPEEIAPEDSLVEGVVNYHIGELKNVFTPNGDGVNDIFSIQSENLTEFTITIINAENKVVYQSSNPNFRWDGTNAYGEPVADGNYVYFITAKEFAGDKPKRYSPLLIKRTR